MGLFDDHIKERQAITKEEEAKKTEQSTEPVVEPQVEPVVEPTEPTTEPTTEPVTEPTAAEPVVVEPGAETPPVEELNDELLNTFFGTTGVTKEDIKNVYAQGVKYSELESKYNENSQAYESLQAQHEEIKKGLNPLKHFSSEQAYIAEQLRIKYPGMDPVAIQRAVTRDLTVMSDLDVLALQDTIRHPGAKGGEAMAKRILAEKHGVDLSEPADQWDDMAVAKIEREALEARAQIKDFQGEVELPATKSEEELKVERANQTKELQQKWTPAMTELTGFDKITIPGKEEGQVFEFEVPQSFRDELPEYFNNIIVNAELEPGPETVKFLIKQRNKDFVYQNLDKIREAIEADLTSRLTKQTDAELNNTTPANTQTSPGQPETVGGTEKFLGGHKGRITRT